MTNIIEGKILKVMESWPLQLVVDTPSGRLDVLLSEDAKITKAGLLVDTRALTLGTKIRLRGHVSPDTTALLTKEIEVVSS